MHQFELFAGVKDLYFRRALPTWQVPVVRSSNSSQTLGIELAAIVQAQSRCMYLMKDTFVYLKLGNSDNHKLCAPRPGSQIDAVRTILVMRTCIEGQQFALE